jgi:hypothetical protein
VIAAELYFLSNSTPVHIRAPETKANRENLNNLDFFGFEPPVFEDGSSAGGSVDGIDAFCSTVEA